MTTPQPQYTTLFLPEPKNQAVNWKDLITKYLYHWPLFILVLFLTSAAAIAYLQLAKPFYEVKASLIIQDEKKAPGQQSALSEIDLLNSTKLLENEIEVLRSKQLIGQVVNDLQLETLYQKKESLKTVDLYKKNPVRLVLLEPSKEIKAGEVSIVIKDKNSFFIQYDKDTIKEFPFDKKFKNSFGTWKLEPTNNLSEYAGSTIKISIMDPELVALQYQKLVNIELTDKVATTIVLTLKDEVAQRGVDVLNQLIFNYNLMNKQENEKTTASTLAFLDKRLDSLSYNLTGAEKGIEEFKSSRGITDISNESKISLENLQTNDKLLNEVKVQLSVINGIETYVNSSNSRQAPALVGISDPALSSLIERLADLQLQRDRLAATTPETNPDFETLDRQIASTRTSIKENVRNIKTSLLNSMAKLQSFNTNLESNIKNIPAQERELISLERQNGIKESLYNYLLQKREELAVNYANTIAKDRVVDRAYAGPIKNPNKPIAFAMALLFGIAIPVGIIYGRNSLNNSIVDLKEIRDALDIPVIADIPFEKSQGLISIDSDNINPMTEQLRALRTNLYYLYGDKEKGRITLLTSSIPGEGKSFISSNLGITLAHIERKTVILEMDLRKPKLDNTFNLKSNHPGITDFLNNKASLQDIIQQSDVNPNLQIISSGTPVNNPSEILERKQLEQLFSDLQNIYDDIIIDSPPVHLVPDAMILSRITDITLYIIRQGFTGKAELDFIRELNNKKRLSNIQIVFNGIQKAKYGYGYNYKSTYYSKTKSSILTNFWQRF